jgi:DNA polymerase III, epsilon subunit and related 3'-5' exonucleases
MNSILEKLSFYYKKKRLKNPNYSFLFEEPPENEYVAFDTETTGLNPKVDDILSIAAVKIKDNKILLNERFNVIVRPDREIIEDAIKIHGLRKKDLESGIPIEEAVDRFAHFIGSRPLVGYYLEFDVAMVNKYFKKLSGTTLPNKQIEVSALYYDFKSAYSQDLLI